MGDPQVGRARPGRTPAIIAGYTLIVAFSLVVLALLADERRDREGRRGEDPRPNFVVIMTDDQTLEQLDAMPRTRRLIADKGVTVDRFYVTTPLCCPSRASFLTGQYSHNHDVTSNEAKAYRALREHHTLAVWLHRARYRTALAGKYLNGYGEDDPERIPPGWDDWRALLEPVDSYYDYDVNENGEVVHYGDGPRDHKTDVIGRLAAEQVREAAASRKPLFLFVSFNAPHAPHEPAPRDEGRYADLPPPESDSFNEPDVADKPSFLRDRPQFDEEALARIASRRQRSLESVLAVDRAVARIARELERQGELENTYLIFTSDNGYFAGEHRIEFGKLLAYEPSSRVPLLIRGPGLPQNEHATALSGNIDLAPTLLALADAEPTTEVDGRSLIPYLADPGRDDDRPLLIESLSRDRSAFYGIPYAAIRTDRYLYVEYETGDVELYDLQLDPEQLESRHDDPAYEATRVALAEALAELRDCAGDSCRRRIPRPPDPE